jgi:hypothetical protein
MAPAKARDDAGNSTVWIELGGQLERLEGGQELFAPDFTTQFNSDKFLSLGRLERTPRYGVGLEGSLSFEPAGSDWTFEVSLRYGRSNAAKSSHDQTATPPILTGTISIPLFGLHQHISTSPYARRFADSYVRARESHTVFDFQAGRDVGLGLFGGKSTVDMGVRVAQFVTKSSTLITADPGGKVPYKYATNFRGFPAYVNAPNITNEVWNIYHAAASISRSFKGIGPSLSFAESVPLVGNRETMLAKLDFGFNGAVLFGRQKADIQYKVDDDTPILPHAGNFKPMTAVYHHSYDRPRSRSVVVPNVGGFAGLSFKYINAEIKLGYRADFFFGAIDGGIDTRKTYDRNFYGPFATVSIGLGG